MDTSTAERLLEALTVEESNINTYKSQLGFTGNEVNECTQDRANLAVALNNVDVCSADSKSVTKVKNLVYEGSTAVSVEPYPTFAIVALPFPGLKAGSLPRYTNRKQRGKLAAGYTEQIGLAMGYADASPTPVAPDALIAAAKLKDAGNYKFEAEFKKQGMSGMAFQYRLKGIEKWGGAFNAIQSPVLISVEPPATEGDVVQIEVRCHLLQGNDLVGQWSPIYPLTVSS